MSLRISTPNEGTKRRPTPRPPPSVTYSPFAPINETADSPTTIYTPTPDNTGGESKQQTKKRKKSPQIHPLSRQQILQKLFDIPVYKEPGKVDLLGSILTQEGGRKLINIVESIRSDSPHSYFRQNQRVIKQQGNIITTDLDLDTTTKYKHFITPEKWDAIKDQFPLAN